MLGITRQYYGGLMSGFGMAVVFGYSLPALSASIHHWQFWIIGMWLIVIGSAIARSGRRKICDSGIAESPALT
jgi:hypothetical protein